jgi:hypothetical protein
MERSHHKGHGPLRQRGGSRVYSGMYKAAAAGALAVGVGSFFNPDITPQQIDLTPTQTQKRAQSKAVGKARLQSIEQEQAERRATERRRAAASQAERRSLASEVNRRGKIQDQRIRQQQHGHHRSGEAYYPNGDSDERGQSSGAVHNNRRW